MPDLEALKAQAGSFLESDELKSMLPYLISGSAAAAAGGLASGRRREEKGESRGGYLARVLRNAVIAGGLGAGGHYLVNKGLESTVGGLADEQAISGDADNEAPLATAVKNVAFSPLTAAGSGALALGMTHNKPIIGAGDTSDFLDRFAKETGQKAKTLRTMTPEEIGQLGGSERLRQLAGLPSDRMREGTKFVEKIPGVKDPAAVKGSLSSLLRRGPLSTFGQSNPRRAGRGALALAAAGVPALLGALLTNEAEAA